MKSFQRIIKYLALAFALFLIVTIISAIFFGISSFNYFLNLENRKSESLELTELNIANNDIKYIDIDVAAVNLIIKKSDSFKIETNSKNIKYKESNDKLKIKEKKSFFLANGKGHDLIIYIKDDIIFNNVDIDTGAGSVTIQDLTTKNIDLDLGAGKLEINRLTSKGKTKIDGGAGAITIFNSNINNLDLDLGAGKFEFNGLLTGNNKVDAGIGKVDINIIDSLDNYTIRAEKGLGSIDINGTDIKNNEVYGNGFTYLEIDGGVGDISIKFDK